MVTKTFKDIDDTFRRVRGKYEQLDRKQIMQVVADNLPKRAYKKDGELKLPWQEALKKYSFELERLDQWNRDMAHK